MPWEPAPRSPLPAACTRLASGNIVLLATATITSTGGNRDPGMPLAGAVRVRGPIKPPAKNPATQARAALLLIDFMNPFDFDGAASLAPRAVRAAKRTAALKRRMQADRAPVIYANDNFGRWESDFEAVVEHCRSRGGASATIADMLAPSEGDRSILKPRHSAFFGTPLEFLLDELAVTRLVLTGLAADSCVMFTAHDAYLRKYELWIPGDCVASERDAYRRDALAHMARTLKANVDPVEHQRARVR
jgi:nicotinamidase-related amidase